MFIVTATVAGTNKMFYLGSASEGAWSTERAEAETYADEAAAQADLAASSFVYFRLKVNAQVVEA